MYFFSSLGPVCCFLSHYHCCFLICLQISQETSKVVWYSHFFKNFPWCAVIHRVKGFGIVSKSEIDFFLLEFSCIFYDPVDVGNWSLFPLPFLNPAWTSGSFWFIYCWSLAWRILNITSLAFEIRAIVQYLEHSLVLPSFVIGIKPENCGVLK